MSIHRFMYWLFLGVGMVLFATIGFLLTEPFLKAVRGWVPEANLSPLWTQIGFTAAGLLLGILVANHSFQLLARVARHLEEAEPDEKLAIGLGVISAAVITFALYPLLFAIGGSKLGWALTLLAFVILVYLSIVSFLSMKDYLPLTAQAGRRKSGVKILDTSVIIDGRIRDILRTGFLEGKTLDVSAEVSGRVTSVLVEEGDAVKAGQVLATLDDEFVRLRIEIADANVAAAQAHLALLEAGARAEDLRQAEARVEQAQAALMAATQAMTDTEALRANPQALVIARTDAETRAIAATFNYTATAKQAEAADLESQLWADIVKQLGEGVDVRLPTGMTLHFDTPQNRRVAAQNEWNRASTTAWQAWAALEIAYANAVAAYANWQDLSEQLANPLALDARVSQARATRARAEANVQIARAARDVLREGASPAQIQAARAALDAGCPYLLLFGWQTGGHDNNYFYRYVPNEDWGGAEALRRAVGECRAMGVEIMPFFNGTLANIEMPEHKEFGHRWEAKTRTGHPYYAGDWARHNFDAPSRNRAMLHTEVAFCAEHRKYFLETVRRIVQDYGFGNTQLDQMAEKMLVDYCEDHITTTPDRVYVDGVNELLPGVRRLVREANPDGVMISEAINEFTGQWCDSSWDWTILLPFPEPILYTLPWLMASHEIDALEFGETNQAFAYKMHFDMKIDGGDAPITKYPVFAEHVKGLAELRHRVADYYVYADFRDQENVKVQGPDTVFVKVYHNKPACKAGIVVAETAGKQSHAALEIGWKSGNGTIAIDTNRGGRMSMEQTAIIEMELAPYEVRVCCINLA